MCKCAICYFLLLHLLNGANEGDHLHILTFVHWKIGYNSLMNPRR